MVCIFPPLHYLFGFLLINFFLFLCVFCLDFVILLLSSLSVCLSFPSFFSVLRSQMFHLSWYFSYSLSVSSFSSNSSLSFSFLDCSPSVPLLPALRIPSLSYLLFLLYLVSLSPPSSLIILMSVSSSYPLPTFPSYLPPFSTPILPLPILSSLSTFLSAAPSPPSPPPPSMLLFLLF